MGISMQHREKKIRGRRKRQEAAEHRRWLLDNRHRFVVTVSQITKDGFWLHAYNKDYYISRSGFPWLQNATDVEIQDVTLMPSNDSYHGDILYWESLNKDISTNCYDWDAMISETVKHK
jgi:hypothetical protein